MQTCLNQMTVPRLSYCAFLDLAAALGCAGIEARNDLGRAMFDGTAPAEAGEMARSRGLRLFGLSQVYPFNDWNGEIEARTRELIETARAAGARTISLIPRNDGSGGGNGERHANLRIALKNILPMLRDTGIFALVEPLGFPRSSLRSKSELVDTIEALDATDTIRIVHDTFHHALAGGGPLYPGHTGIVHVSGVAAPAPDLAVAEDEHRVLVDERDVLGNVEQVSALLAAGYDGPVSYECFAPEIHALDDPERALGRAFDYLTSQLEEKAA